MTTQNINISKQNISGKCDLKCSYNFKYSETNLTAKNNGVSIALTTDSNKIPPVTYNNQKYNVTNIEIVSPSIHLFNGTTAAAEIIINHTPIQGGSQLNVAIPITSSSESSTASTLITQIIQSVSSNAPAANETTNLSINDFTLQDIVPSKPFYSYTGASDNTDYIVFDITNAIPLSSSIITTLQQIIKPFPLPTPGGKLFFNSTGPNTTKVSEGIYISCKPTGSSDEETAVTYNKNVTTYDFTDLTNNPTVKLIFQIIIGCLLFIGVFLAVSYGYSYIVNGEAKMPDVVQQFKIGSA
jgi:carbonic anhydrase